MWTKRTVATAAVAALAAAGVTGVAVAVGSGSEQGPAAVLDSLVEDGTISSQDADAFERVADELWSEREEKVQELREQRQAFLDEVAATIGISTDEMVQRWRDGESLSDIAGDQADEVAALLTEAAQERLAEIEASIPDRVEGLMNREGGFAGHGMRGQFGHRGGGMGVGPGMGFGPGAGFGPGMGFRPAAGVGPGMGFGPGAAEQSGTGQNG
jgi:polyhydroxyalkanoate synthesis regulator phasin